MLNFLLSLYSLDYTTQLQTKGDYKKQVPSFVICSFQYFPSTDLVVQYTNSSPQTLSSPDQRLTFDKIHLCLLEKIIKEVGFKIKTLSSPHVYATESQLWGFIELWLLQWLPLSWQILVFFVSKDSSASKERTPTS